MKKEYQMNQNFLELKKNILAGIYPDITKPENLKNLLYLLNREITRNAELEIIVQELKLSLNSSDEIRERFANLFNIAPLPYFIINRSGKIIQSNLQAQKFFEIVTGNDPYLLSHLTTDSVPVFEDFLHRLMKTGSIESCEVQFLSPKNSYYFVLLNGTSSELYDEESAGRFLISMTDISLNKETEIRLRQITEDLETIIANKNRFFSVIAHDLRAPFHNLMSITEIIINEFKEQSSQPTLKLLNGFEKLVKNEYNLVSNLLVWANLQNNKIVFVPEKLNFRQTLEECIDHIRFDLDKKGVIIINNLSREYEITADRIMLSSIILNLITNAAKFSYPNGVISISAEPEGAFLKVTIRDRGKGIEPYKMETLFDSTRIASSAGTDGEKGTGLGLIICKDYVERHKGKLYISSEPGTGTKVVFTMPFTTGS